MRGFGLRAWPSGQKTFFVRYRNREGRIRKLNLGRYGTLTVDQARARARAELGAVAQGEDPAAAVMTIAPDAQWPSCAKLTMRRWPRVSYLAGRACRKSLRPSIPIAAASASHPAAVRARARLPI